jgi:hypothetical protein
MPKAKTQGNLRSAVSKDHKNDQPDTKNAQTKNRRALQEAHEQSHDLVVR